MMAVGRCDATSGSLHAATATRSDGSPSRDLQESPLALFFPSVFPRADIFAHLSQIQTSSFCDPCPYPWETRPETHWRPAIRRASLGPSSPKKKCLLCPSLALGYRTSLRVPFSSSPRQH